MDFNLILIYWFNYLVIIKIHELNIDLIWQQALICVNNNVLKLNEKYFVYILWNGIDYINFFAFFLNFQLIIFFMIGDCYYALIIGIAIEIINLKMKYILMDWDWFDW